MATRRRHPYPAGARARLALLGAALVVIVAVVIASRSGGPPPGPPLPGIGRPAKGGDPFAYMPGRESEFIARATAGSANPLFVKSPGGAVATAARVARFRSQIERATAGTGIDPDLLEGLVFVESAGRPQIIAGSDPSAAAGLTQILAQTGQGLLGMRVDLPASRRLTRRIFAADAAGQVGRLGRLLARRARIDERFDPRKALAATVRYLKLAESRLGGREDLAFVSYHMGIGNLSSVLRDYDGGQPVPYAQLYFDTAPDHHASAYRLLSGFGDDSSLYYWRLLGAVQIMRLYRTDRPALLRLSRLETATASTAEVLHPPDTTPSFADPAALSAAYGSRVLRPLPRNAAQLGLAYARMGSFARKVNAPAALYQGLRPAALDLLVELAARVRTLSGGRVPLTVQSTVSDRRYQQRIGVLDPPAQTGYTFEVARRYVDRAQAQAFQAMLDRLQALNLIGWSRRPATISITVAAGASQLIAAGL